MIVSGCQAFLIALAALAVGATADYDITTERSWDSGFSTNGHLFVKGWTLTSRKPTGSIEAIHLSLAGNAYVTYVSGLPANVVGYVNVSSSSRDVVNAVSVAKRYPHDDDDDDEDMANLDVLIKNKLSVKLKKKVTSGDLLTEIVLAVPNSVVKVKSQRSAQIVVKDRVLVENNDKSKLKIKAEDSSAVYVSGSHVTLRKLFLRTTDRASIEYNVDDVMVKKKLKLKAKKGSNIKLLSSSVKANELSLKAKGDDSRICLSAKKVVTKESDVSGKKRVSVPNSSERLDAEGTFVCKASILPPRTRAEISSTRAGTINRGESYSDDDLEHLF